MLIGNYWWLCVSSANSYQGNKTFGKVATIGWKHIAMDFYENHNGSFFGLIKSCHVRLKCIWEINQKRDENLKTMFQSSQL